MDARGVDPKRVFVLDRGQPDEVDVATVPGPPPVDRWWEERRDMIYLMGMLVLVTWTMRAVAAMVRDFASLWGA